MIDHNTIQKIIDTADIVDVVQDFVNLKKRGVNYLGLCPFHNEKTPSFTVSPSKGIYKCFGCGKGGNVVNFIMEHEHLSYPEALKYLAKKYHIEVEEKERTAEEIKQHNERESLLVITEYANKYFKNNLFQHDDGKAIGLSYFRERGLNEATIKKFELGYSLDQRDAFFNAARAKGYKKEYIVKTGLVIEKENSLYDRFRGRVMFPIHSLSGNVVGFGGRILKSDAKAAKYLNSPESDIYHKSKVLYGMYQAKQTITKADKCYLVEGYTDVLSMHQNGIENVVASSGTALTEDQIRLIKRFTPNVTIIYDGDEAGIKASLRGIDMVLEQGMNVKVVLLPEGEDPDSFSKNMNVNELNKYIADNEKDFISFKLQLLKKETENDPVKKSQMINDIVRTVSVIPDGITRSVYIKNCSKELDVNEKMLYSEVNKKRRKYFEDKFKRANYNANAAIKQESVTPKQQQQSIENKECNIQEREIIRLLINYGNKPLFNLEKEDELGDKETETIYVSDFIINELTKDDLELFNS